MMSPPYYHIKNSKNLSESLLILFNLFYGINCTAEAVVTMVNSASGKVICTSSVICVKLTLNQRRAKHLRQNSSMTQKCHLHSFQT